MPRKPSTRKPSSRRRARPTILPLEDREDLLNLDLTRDICPDVLLSLPEDAEFRAEILLINGIALVLDRLPPDRPEVRDRVMAEFREHLLNGVDRPGCTFGLVLAGVVKVNCAAQISRLFPLWESAGVGSTGD